MRTLISLAILIFLVIPLVTSSQNVSDTSNYYGTIKALKIKIKLTLLLNQLDASEIVMRYNKNQTAFKFFPDKEQVETKGSLNFVHFSSNKWRFSDYFSIRINEKNLQPSPYEFYGTYFFKDSEYKFVLTKKP